MDSDSDDGDERAHPLESNVSITNIHGGQAHHVGDKNINIPGTLSQDVRAGSTLALTTISGLTPRLVGVEVGFIVENWTRFILADPLLFINGGWISIPPRPVRPGDKEAIAAYKGGGATGSSGTCSFEVNGKRVYFMWSAPFDFTSYKNWLAVGIRDANVNHTSEMFDIMYYKEEEWFRRDSYYYNCNMIKFNVDGLEIQGSMGTNHHPIVNIIVKPIEEEDLAYCLRNPAANN